MRKIYLSIPAAGAAMAAAAMLIPGAGSAQDEVPRWQQARATGEPVSCVPLRQIRQTQVRDDRTIDFEMTGGQVYRNVLPHECNGLGFEEAFSYSTSLSQLCSTDIITVIPRGGAGIPGPSCGLGKFQPIEYPEEAE